MNNSGNHSDFDPYHTWLGIPPSQQPANLYRLLGLELYESEADVIDVAANRQSAYLRQVGAGELLPIAKQLMAEVASARRILIDDQARRKYDQQLKMNFAAPTSFDPSTTSIPLILSEPKLSKSAHSNADQRLPNRSARKSNSRGRFRKRTTVMLVSAVLAVVVVIGGGLIASRDWSSSPNRLSSVPISVTTPASAGRAPANNATLATSSIAEAFDRKFEAAEKSFRQTTAKPTVASRVLQPKVAVAKRLQDVASLPIIIDFQTDAWKSAIVLANPTRFAEHCNVLDGRLRVSEPKSNPEQGAEIQLKNVILKPGESVSLDARMPSGMSKASGLTLVVGDAGLIILVRDSNAIVVRVHDASGLQPTSTEVVYEKDPDGNQIPYSILVTRPDAPQAPLTWRIDSPAGKVYRGLFDATGLDDAPVVLRLSRTDSKRSHFWIDNIRYGTIKVNALPWG